jgi:hypothetical protein
MAARGAIKSIQTDSVIVAQLAAAHNAAVSALDNEKDRDAREQMARYVELFRVAWEGISAATGRT